MQFRSPNKNGKAAEMKNSKVFNMIVLGGLLKVCPVVGTLHVGGLTKKQAEDLIKNKVKPYLAEKENPIVTFACAM